MGPTAQFYSKFCSVLAGGIGGLLGGVLLGEAIEDRRDENRDDYYRDDYNRDDCYDNRGFGDLQHYFAILLFYSRLSMQTTTVAIETLVETFFKIFPIQLHHIERFVHNRPEIFFSS